MATRIQVVVDEEERESFRRQAQAEGLSLSAWLRQAGRERLNSRALPSTGALAALRRFFAECDAHEKGREPDWQHHLEVIEASRQRGSSGT
jgi:hypothetical protein